MCPSCFECYSCKDLGKDGRGNCVDCKVECKLIYKMQLLVKDASSQMNKNFYRLLLYSFDEHRCQDFFQNVPKPVNLYHDTEALNAIDRQVKIMVKFNVWIDAIIERQSTFFVLRDTRIRIKL